STPARGSALAADSRYYRTPSPRRRTSEVGGERARAAREQRRVEADRDEQGAGSEIAARALGIRGEDAGRLARGDHRGDAVGDRLQHVGVAGVAEVAERGRQIGRPEEDAVDALGPRN